MVLRALSIENADDTASGYGGAVQNDQGGTLLVTDVNFSGDQATDGGAIDNGDDDGHGDLTVTASSFNNDTATNGGQTAGDGGAIDNGDHHGHGHVTITNGTFSNDIAFMNGGAIDNGDNFGEGDLLLSGSTLSDNVSDANNQNGFGDGGAIDNGDDDGHGDLTVTGSVLSGNSGGAPQTSGSSGGDGVGGAINNGNASGGYGALWVVRSDLVGNGGGDGGAIDNGNGTVSVVSSTLSGNESDGAGGAIESDNDMSVSRSVLANNLAGSNGGAIDNEGTLGHHCACLVVSGSTFYNNYAGEYQAGINYAGRYGAAGPPAPGQPTFGIAFSQADGGALENDGGSLLVLASTFSGDSEYGDSEIASTAGTVLLGADIIDETCQNGHGSWHDLGYNIGEDRSCLRGTRGDVAHGASKLAALADNGGPSWTMLPLKGSPALGAVPYGTTLRLGHGRVTLCPTTDQRGVKSTSGRPCDSGAVQLPAST
jgi:hypothetical protein